MLSKLAKKMTSFFISRNLIEESRKEVYDYSFEVLLSTLLNGLSLFIIALFSNTFLYSILYVFAFILMRGSAGGYHAKTHFGCLILLLATYIVFLLLIKFISGTILFYLTIIFSVFSLISVFLFAPVENINNPLTDEEKIKLARKSIVYSILILLIAYSIIFFAKDMKYSFSLIFGLTSVCLFLPIGKIWFLRQSKRRK